MNPMTNSRYSTKRIIYIIIAGIVLGVVFTLKALQNYTHQDYVNTNFFFFWLSGHMVWTGHNPYDQISWLAGHDAFGATWKPNKIFPYPLPLMFFMAPLGLLTLGQAYIAWQIVTMIIIALCVFILLRHWLDSLQYLLFLPIIIILLFFGPVYLTLQIGSIGALALASILFAIVSMEKDHSLLAGMILSFTILKPPQGLTILILAGIWFIARKDWKAILGIIVGGLVLVVIGWLRDPLWIIKFRGSSETVLDRTLGIQSNIYSFAYLACKQNIDCMWIAGSIGTLIVMGGGGFYLWRKGDQLTAWEAFNIIIPIGFLSTIYLWSYDQVPYLIPILWIVKIIVNKTKSYAYALLLLIGLDIISFIGLVVQANTHTDLLSITTTILIFGLCLWLFQLKNHHPIDKPIPAA